MPHLNDFRNPDVASHLLARIGKLAREPLRVMEICGGHTHAIFRFGLQQVLPPQIEWLHGPGCPVCVTPVVKFDKAIALAHRPNTIVAAYGDLLRVPGRESTLLRERAEGGDVRVVYSSMDAVSIALQNPHKNVVFFAVGFETTAPANAFSILAAKERHLENFTMLANHVLVPPVIRALLEDSRLKIDAFLGPGHVSAVVGSQEYEFIAREYGRPVVVSGFELNDILQSILMILTQRDEGRCDVEVEYARAVRDAGNAKAKAVIADVFERQDQEWRGLGIIADSGLRIKHELSEYDAEIRFADFLRDISPPPPPKGCICAAILKGQKRPFDCPSFASSCTPERPLGACMVSSEGACAAYYSYRQQPLIQGGTYDE